MIINTDVTDWEEPVSSNLLDLLCARSRYALPGKFVGTLRVV